MLNVARSSERSEGQRRLTSSLCLTLSLSLCSVSLSCHLSISTSFPPQPFHSPALSTSLCVNLSVCHFQFHRIANSEVQKLPPHPTPKKKKKKSTDSELRLSSQKKRPAFTLTWLKGATWVMTEVVWCLSKLFLHWIVLKWLDLFWIYFVLLNYVSR